MHWLESQHTHKVPIDQLFRATLIIPSLSIALLSSLTISYQYPGKPDLDDSYWAYSVHPKRYRIHRWPEQLNMAGFVQVFSALDRQYDFSLT